MRNTVRDPLKSEREAAGLCVYCPAKGQANPVVVRTDGRVLKQCQKCKDEDAARKAARSSTGLGADPSPSAEIPMSRTEEFTAMKAVALAEGKCINCYIRPQGYSLVQRGKKIQSCDECRNRGRVRKGLKPILAQEPVVADKPSAARGVTASSPADQPNPTVPDLLSRPESEWSEAEWSKALPMDDKDLMLARFGPECEACLARPPALANGGFRKEAVHFDHIEPKKRNGIPGTDAIWNRALLCPVCNQTKGNRMTLDELRKHNAEKNLIAPGFSYKDLPDRHERAEFAIAITNRRFLNEKIQNEIRRMERVPYA